MALKMILIRFFPFAAMAMCFCPIAQASEGDCYVGAVDGHPAFARLKVCLRLTEHFRTDDNQDGFFAYILAELSNSNTPVAAKIVCVAERKRGRFEVFKCPTDTKESGQVRLFWAPAEDEIKLDLTESRGRLSLFFREGQEFRYANPMKTDVMTLRRSPQTSAEGDCLHGSNGAGDWMAAVSYQPKEDYYNFLGMFTPSSDLKFRDLSVRPNIVVKGTCKVVGSNTLSCAIPGNEEGFVGLAFKPDSSGAAMTFTGAIAGVIPGPNGETLPLPLVFDEKTEYQLSRSECPKGW